MGESRTLFSSHTDTVHQQDGPNAFVRCVETAITPLGDGRTNIVYRANGSQLGADCGAGVALMVHMITNGIPGHYVFHAAEEVGGIGSTALAESGVFKNMFDRAIAFDRKATHSIITHQRGGQCCSTEFAEALAGQLNDANLDFMFAPDDSGVYTDTAEYVGQIPECTNVSVGYYNEHTMNERLDFTFFEQLANAVLLVQWETLPVGVIPPPKPRLSIANYAFRSAFTDPFPIFGDDPDEVSATGLSCDWDAVDDLYILLDSYPEMLEECGSAYIENIANVLGTEGVALLSEYVNSGMYTTRQFSDALWDPQGFLNELPKNVAAQEKV